MFCQVLSASCAVPGMGLSLVVGSNKWRNKGENHRMSFLLEKFAKSNSALCNFSRYRAKMRHDFLQEISATLIVCIKLYLLCTPDYL